MSRGAVAKSVRERKERSPHLFCAHPKCLWRIATAQGPNPCRNHPVSQSLSVAQAPEPYVLLIACPECRGQFSHLSELPLVLTCPLCGHAFDDLQYTRLRDRVRVVTRELEAART